MSGNRSDIPDSDNTDSDNTDSDIPDSDIPDSDNTDSDIPDSDNTDSDNTNENRRKTESTFSTEYPYNQATVSRGGHEFHINDAPGKESLKVAHTQGTYVEIESDGAWRQVVQAKTTYYHKDGVTFTSDGHVDHKIRGNYSLNADISMYTATKGDYILGMGKSYQLAIGGDYIQRVMGLKDETVTGDVTKEFEGNEFTSVKGSKFTVVNANRADTIEDDWQIAVGKNIDINCDADFKVKCKNFTVDAEAEVLIKTPSGFIKIDADGKITIEASEITIEASGGNVVINGQQVRIND